MRLEPLLANAHLLCYDKRRSQWDAVQNDVENLLGVRPRPFVMGYGHEGGLRYDHTDRHHGPLPDRQRLNYLEGVHTLLHRELRAGAEHAFLLEDDCQSHPASHETWRAVQEQLAPLPDFPFDFFYLHAVRINSWYDEVTPNVLRLHGCLGFRAVVLSKRAMEAITRLAPTPSKGVDGLIMDEIHGGMAVYSAYPCVLRADRGGHSYQHDMTVLPEWLDMCVAEKGQPRR